MLPRSETCVFVDRDLVVTSVSCSGIPLNRVPWERRRGKQLECVDNIPKQTSEATLRASSSANPTRIIGFRVC